jgi:trehalose 6-phosphate phosphatase
VQTWVVHLEQQLGACPGVQVENKRYSVAVHYRRSNQPRQALAAIKQAVRQLRGYRLIGGDRTVNLVPKGAPHKGVALERARRLLVCDTAIYVGDDDTDEDAFKAGRSDRLLAIRIGMNRRSRARYCLKRQALIDDFLQALLSLRPIRHRTPSARVSVAS